MTTRELFGSAAAMLVVLCAAVAPQAGRPALAAPGGPDGELPERLADTGLYAAGGLTIDPRNRAFSPQYPLWTDGMAKSRWVYIPAGAAIEGSREHAWEFPAGTKLWKEFSLNGRKVETRLLWKTTDGRWLMGSYAWNAEGTAAELAPIDGFAAVAEVAPGRRHSIPSRSDCAACHGSKRPQPLGFNALQLSPDRDPHAIHGDALGPGMVTLETLVSEGLLQGARQDILRDPPRIRTADPATRAVLGYLAANCGTCHDGNGEIAALAPVIRYEDLTRDADAVARSLARQPTRWQVPGVEGTSLLLHPGNPELSAMVVRMRSRAPSSQMPPLGTVVRDDQAIDAIARWIAIAADSERLPSALDAAGSSHPAVSSRR